MTAKVAANAEAKAIEKAAVKKAVARRFRHSRIGRIGRRIH